MVTETHTTPRNRRSFLRMVALGAGMAALVACGATAAKPSLTAEEQAKIEALGDEMAAAIAAGDVPKTKGSYQSSGTVKWYSQAKGFGFIADESSVDIFFHRLDVRNGQILQVGQSVEYTVSDGPKGLVAGDIRFR